MKNRIQDLFKGKQENILSIYFTAGYPELEDTLTIVRHLDICDVDLIEIGFPFSDPLADGPTIQKSSQKAIDNGMCLDVLFDQLQVLRKVSQIPVVLMGYLNPVIQYGEENFVRKCNEIGIDGVIIPDMPLSYYEDNLKGIYEAYNLCNILLITPETPEERIRRVDALSTGFVYMVSSNSITGGKNEFDSQERYFNRIKNMNIENPRLIGFGIHDNKTFLNACQYSGGAIIGSAFINHISDNGISEQSIKTFIESIKL